MTQNSYTFNRCYLNSNATHHVYRNNFSQYAKSVSPNKVVYPAHSTDINQLAIFDSYQPQIYEIPRYQPMLRSKQYMFSQLLVDKQNIVPQQPAAEDRAIAQKLIDQSSRHVSTSLFLQDQIHQCQIDRVSPNQKSMSPRQIQNSPPVNSHLRLKSSGYLQNLNSKKYQSSSKTPKMAQYSASHQRSRIVQKSPLFEKYQHEHPKIINQTQPNDSSDSVLFKGASVIDASFDQHIKKLNNLRQQASDNVAKIVYLDDQKLTVFDETQSELEAQREVQLINTMNQQIPTQDDIKVLFYSAPVSLEEVAFSPLSKIAAAPRKLDININSRKERRKVAKNSANTSHELLPPQANKEQNEQSVVSQNDLGLTGAHHASLHHQQDVTQNQKSDKDQQIIQQEATIACCCVSPQTQGELGDDVSKSPEIENNYTSDEDKKIQEEKVQEVSPAQNLDVIQNEDISANYSNDMVSGDKVENLQQYPEQLQEKQVEVLESLNNTPIADDIVQDETIKIQQQIVESTFNDKKDNALEQELSLQPEIALNNNQQNTCMIKGVVLSSHEQVQQQQTDQDDSQKQCEQNETKKDIANVVDSEHSKD